MNNLLLLSGNDIPFIQAEISIHQPTIKEIAYIGEQNFFMGYEYLNFSKQDLKSKDKNHLENFSNFEILMAMINNNNEIIVKKYKVCIELLLLLLFPQYKIDFLPASIMISKINEKQEKQIHLLDKNNFNIFQDIINQIFCLKSFMQDDVSKKYNPKGPQARALVEKFKQRQKKLNNLKNKKQSKFSIFSRYISILSVGLQKDMNKLLQYTVYQLFDEFNRFKLKEQYEMYVKAKMAGAKDIQQVENWMKDIHS